MFDIGPLARWLRENGRSRFLFTGPPLRMPGAVGSPATPVATGVEERYACHEVLPPCGGGFRVGGRFFSEVPPTLALPRKGGGKMI